MNTIRVADADAGSGAMKRVYVAGAYRSNNVLGVLDNMREGMRWSTKVLLAGYAPFCPWVDFHFQLMVREDGILSGRR